MQEVDLILRKKWLNQQLFRIGQFVTIYDENEDPVSFTVLPITSYAAKLIQAYKILGGNPELDMLLRTRDKPVFLTGGPEISVSEDGLTLGGYSQLYSNGRRDRGDQRFDRNIGLRIEALKRWQLEVIKQKRERLEYKIKRALDYSDQIQQEIELIDKLSGQNSIYEPGSIDDLIINIRQAMLDPENQNTVNDSQDIRGRNIGTIADNTVEDPNESITENRRGLPPGYERG